MNWTDKDEFELPTPTLHTAVCYKMVDLGTRPGPYGDKREVMIFWELADQKMSDGRPFMQSAFYPQTLAEGSKLREDLEAWRGRAFTTEELAGFDPRTILGKPCQLILAKKKKKKPEDKDKIIVKSVLAFTAGVPAPTLVNKTLFFSFEKFDKDIFDSLSVGIKRMVMESHEYARIMAGQPPTPPAEKKAVTDDIPF